MYISEVEDQVGSFIFTVEEITEVKAKEIKPEVFKLGAQSVYCPAARTLFIISEEKLVIDTVHSKVVADHNTERGNDEQKLIQH